MCVCVSLCVCVCVCVCVCFNICLLHPQMKPNTLLCNGVSIFSNKYSFRRMNKNKFTHSHYLHKHSWPGCWLTHSFNTSSHTHTHTHTQAHTHNTQHTFKPTETVAKHIGEKKSRVVKQRVTEACRPQESCQEESRACVHV